METLCPGEASDDVLLLVDLDGDCQLGVVKRGSEEVCDFLKVRIEVLACKFILNGDFTSISLQLDSCNLHAFGEGNLLPGKLIDVSSPATQEVVLCEWLVSDGRLAARLWHDIGIVLRMNGISRLLRNGESHAGFRVLKSASG